MELARWSPLGLLALAAVAVPSHAGTPAESSARAKQGVKAEIKRGTLTITGNRRANSVTLRLKRRARGTLEVDVRSNGSADFRFKRKAFRRIVVRGGRGNDKLGISERNGSFFRSERTTLDGGRGTDRLVFTGSGRADAVALSANGRRLRLARVTAARLERVQINPLGGADTITLGDLSGSGIGRLGLDFGSSAGRAARRSGRLDHGERQRRRRQPEREQDVLGDCGHRPSRSRQRSSAPMQPTG